MLKRTAIRNNDLQSQATSLSNKQALCATDEADAWDFLELEEMTERFEADVRAYMAV